LTLTPGIGPNRNVFPHISRESEFLPIGREKEAHVRFLTLASALVWFTVAAPAHAHAQTADAELMAPIQKFVDAFNKGDAATAATTHAAGADLTIVDEVPPYLWRGPKAFHAWGADLESDAKKQGITEPMVALSAPTRIEKQGDQAYVVVPAVFTFKQRGAAMREAAQMTFVLKKGTSGWLIHAWAWTGPKPTPSAGAGKPSEP
jgi:ketosteroid isomerase-like protein